eukprot:RCo018013
MTIEEPIWVFQMAPFSGLYYFGVFSLLLSLLRCFACFPELQKKTPGVSAFTQLTPFSFFLSFSFSFFFNICARARRRYLQTRTPPSCVAELATYLPGMTCFFVSWGDPSPMDLLPSHCQVY